MINLRDCLAKPKYALAGKPLSLYYHSYYEVSLLIRIFKVKECVPNLFEM